MLMRTPTCCRPHRPSSSLKRNVLSVTFLRNVADVAGEICLLLPLGFFAIGGPTLGCLDNPKFQDLKSLLLWGPLSLGTEQNARDVLVLQCVCSLPGSLRCSCRERYAPVGEICALLQVSVTEGLSLGSWTALWNMSWGRREESRRENKKV